MERRIRTWGYWLIRSANSSRMDELTKISRMSSQELLAVFKDTTATRMDVCKAGERILAENIHISEQAVLRGECED